MHGLTETTLPFPYISQGDDAPDSIRDVPAPLHIRDTLGKRPMRCLEIPARPIGEAQERRCRTAPYIVVLRNKVERPLTVLHRGGHIATHQGIASPVDGYPTWQTAKF